MHKTEKFYGGSKGLTQGRFDVQPSAVGPQSHKSGSRDEAAIGTPKGVRVVACSVS